MNLSLPHGWQHEKNNSGFILSQVCERADFWEGLSAETFFDLSIGFGEELFK